VKVKVVRTKTARAVHKTDNTDLLTALPPVQVARALPSSGPHNYFGCKQYDRRRSSS